MYNLDEYNEILYTERKKYIITFLTALSAFIAIKFQLRGIENLEKDIINIIFLIGSCYILLLIKFTQNIYTQGFFKVCSVLHIYIFTYCILGLLSEKSEVNSIFLQGGGENIEKSIFFYIMSVLLAFQVNYINENRKYTLILISISIGLIFSNYYIINQGYSYGIREFIDIISILILLNNIVGLKNYDLFRDKRVNYITLYSIELLIILFMYIIQIILKGNDKVFFTYAIEGLIFAMSIAGASVMSEHLISTPYNVIFRDLYEKNKELDRLNKRVLSRNKELEYIHKVMINKESILRSFFANVPIPLVIINEGNERIVFANSSFCNLIEAKSIRGVINRKIFSFVGIENNPFFNNEYKADTTIFTGVINVGKTKKYTDMEVIHILDDEEKRIVIFTDISEAVKAAKMKETMESKKMDERLKSDFLSNISHDLKTPINVIYSATQITKMYIENNNYESVKKYNNISKQNCISLIRLTNNIIDTSRIYANYLSPNLVIKNIVDVVEDVVTSLVDYAKSKKIDLVFDTDEEELFVKIDDEFMQRIILNLVSNAIKFTNPDGTIEIVIANNEEIVEITIKDDGVGMEKTFIENAFNRYSMGKNNENIFTKGTGIGLFVVKTLVEKQDGTIKINSKLNKGTSIKITFKREKVQYEEY